MLIVPFNYNLPFGYNYISASNNYLYHTNYITFNKTLLHNKKYLQTMIKSYYLNKSKRIFSIHRFYSLNNIYKQILVNKSYGRLSILFLPHIIKSFLSRNLEKNNYKYSIKKITSNSSNNNNYFPIFSFLLVSNKTNRHIISNIFSTKFLYRLFLPL